MLVSATAMVKLNGYEILGQIYAGSRTIVYRGQRILDQQLVAIKLLQSEYPRVKELVQFRNQYTIAKNLDHAGIIKTYSLENYRNGYALVMEDFGGISLLERIGTWGEGGMGATTDGLHDFFNIAIQIVSSLDGLYRHQVIHKDIKPANILINPTTGEVKLIDFSIASLLKQESQTLRSLNVLEGTLAYLSPEQTGRMNRLIDYRTDFYSLGVTFYQLLTGQLPFNSDDPIELVYCHLAKQPPQIHSINPAIPLVLSDIISKLMAKNAEDRYQSALGLKHDLESCLQQWQETGNIVPFELGRRDISDRFIIPEKLYGREAQVKTLLEAFERVTGNNCEPPLQGGIELVLIAGFSGVGKTALVNEIHKPIVRARGYFIKGKFDQFQSETPFLGFVQAFQDLIGQLLTESIEQVEEWKAKIKAAVGENGQVIIDLIPEVELLIGKQPPLVELEPNAAQNRFDLVFQKFIRVFPSANHPLVMFLDDLHSCDSASLRLIQSLMSDTETQHLLLIGAYRDNEVETLHGASLHPLMLTLNEIGKIGAIVNTITLTPLSLNDLNCLIADTLNAREDIAIPLTQFVFGLTKGNPFFSSQLLKTLHEDGLITFNPAPLCPPEVRGDERGVGWQWDISQVSSLSLTSDVVEFMSAQLKKLPAQTQEAIKIAACIGNSFELETVAIVYGKSPVETADDLWEALQTGLILQESVNSQLLMDNCHEQLAISHEQLAINYIFLHDRVQQAAYFLIPEDQKKFIHLKIGQLLLNNDRQDAYPTEEKIFEIVNQLNLAQELIIPQVERDELAQLNLIAGGKAKASTAYTAAVKYLTTGIQLLPDDSWETNYDLTLALYESGAEVAYLSGDFEQMEQLVEVVLAQAKTLLEKVKVYEVKIQAYGSQNKALEAVNTALTVLKQLGVEFPENPNQLDVQHELEKTAKNLANRRIENLIHLPQMKEAQPLAAMRILSSAIALTYQAVPELFPLLVFKQINLSLKHGNAPFSAFAYVAYGVILCGVVGDLEQGYQFGKLALDLVAKLNIKEVKTKIMEVFNAAIRHWKEHGKEILKPLLEAYSAGLETGDLEFAAYSLNAYSYCSYFIGRDMAELERDMATYSNAIGQIKQEIVLNWNAIYRQLVLNLLGAVENPCRLIGEFYDEEKMLPLHLEAKDGFGILHLYFSKLHLCYLLQEFPQAVENATLAEKYLNNGMGQLVFPLFHFYDSLARLAVYPDATDPEQKRILDRVQANQEKMQKWALYAPMNYLHKFYLVEAERNWVLNNNVEAMDNYDRAIALAKENEYINEEALAYELAAKFYLEWGKEIIAQTYMANAYYAYERWGALAKLSDLEKRYPQLLTSIRRRENISLNVRNEIITDPATSISTSSTDTNSISCSSISEALDLATFIKASLALSGEIQLDKLLSTVMQVVIENAGAQNGALILHKSENLVIEAQATHGKEQVLEITCLQSIPVQESQDIPVTLVNYVARTSQALVINDVTTETTFATDPYIIEHQPKSVMCTPIRNQGKVIGILYLENNLTTGAFTHDREQVLKLLVTQAAISLENAILYTNLAVANGQLEDYNCALEQKVAQRTQEINQKNQDLAQTLQELKRTQSQLIQTEKMSSLGQMVAGIAHEINNPINFISGNLVHVNHYVQDLLDLIAVYQQECSHPTPLVDETIEQIDLDFLVEDLPKLLNSMIVGSDRIRNIVLGLRNFSRLDEADMKPVDIHEGIDNTVMILQHRLQDKNGSMEIQVIKEYGKLPQITCYTSQLNQAFMNILSNAIDALKEQGSRGVGEQGSRGVGEQGGKVDCLIQNPQIRICTELKDNNTVRIRIADNGIGMTKEVQQKIFDPFFTTKPVGSGTGLGLSISYQIVVEKHKGRLTCDSTPGKGTEFIIEIPLQQL